MLHNLNLRIPATTILGAYEFDKFIEINNLYDDLYAQNNYTTIRNHFLEADFDEETNSVISISAIDNLMKGAAGSAVQCMNLMMGWDETLGLEFCGLHPV